MDQIAIATPAGRLRGESSARYALVWDGGFRSGVRATTTAAGWPHDFSGAFGREARILWGSWRGLTVLGRVLCGCVAWAMCAGAARVRPDGEARALADLWGYCGYTMLVRGV